jgi:GntR family transcriptional regulator
MPSKRPELPSARVERTLRQRIADGTYAPDSQLPPMDDIAAELKVSRGTVAAVLRKLAAEDPPLVRVIAGYGSFVAPSPTAN